MHCICTHWDALARFPPACLPATPIQLQLCHPQNLQQMHCCGALPQNCWNLPECNALCRSSVVEKSAKHFEGGERCWERHWTLTSRQLAAYIWSWQKLLAKFDLEKSCHRHSILTKVAGYIWSWKKLSATFHLGKSCQLHSIPRKPFHFTPFLPFHPITSIIGF